MPRRFSVNVRAWIYRYLCQRDGEHCGICLAQPTNPISATQNEPISATQNSDSGAVSATQNGHSRRHKITLEIDHRDGNPRNNHYENLRLLCKRCNVAESNRQRFSSDFSLSLKKRRRKYGNPATQIVRNAVDYNQGTAQMQVNNYCEPTFRNWLLGKLGEAGVEFLDKDDVVNSGAEVAGCSTATAVTYLKKLTSSAGPLLEQQDLLGRTNIVLKPELAAIDGNK